ncbi:MAG: hypothetical protein GXP49_08425 [Deltaproteobacteria bacterium]|nr:hypothetical protein [Deltaproteobacteria bacterium]
MRYARVMPLLVLLLFGVLTAEAGEKPKLAVMDLKADVKMEKGTVNTLNQLLLTAFHDSGLFEVIGSTDIRAMLTLEEDRIKLTGCSDDSCLAEIGGALGAKYVALARIGKLGEEFILSLSLLDVKQARVVERTSQEIPDDESRFVGAIKQAVVEITSGVPGAIGGSGSGTGKGEKSASGVWSWTPWVMVGLSVVAGATGGVLGGLAYSDGSDASSRYAGDPAVKDLQDSSESKALAADILFGLGGGAAVAAVLMFVLAPEPGDSGVTAMVLPCPGGAGAAISIVLP